MTTYSVRGESEAGGISLLPLQDSKLSVRQSVLIGSTLRDDLPPVDLDVDRNDLLEIELENGFVLWTTIDRLEADVDTAGIRERGDTGFPSRYPLLRRGDERGVVADAIRAVRVLDIDLPKGAARIAAAKVEGQLAGDGQFFRVSADGTLTREDPAATAADEPTLVLIHGTASSTANAYAGFFEENIATFREIHDRYEGRVYGFEHRTLSRNPVQNALEFLDAIPPSANLHLVTHSRGGLVGDLLAHGGISEDAFAEDDLNREIELAYAHDDAVREEQLKLYRLFNRAIRDVAPNVRRYVRVGCPAAGTTLASRRLDVYFSIFIHLLRQIPGAGPMLGGLGEFAAAVAKERTDPQSLPGLEAQMPTSPLVRLLNGSQHRLETDLTVLAGDSDGFIKNLANLFYWRANDLVVDTRSMYGGAPRAQRLWHLEENRHVTHVNYFRRLETARIVQRGLFREDTDTDGFLSTRPKGVVRGRVKAGKPSENPELPGVILLPGIMGSNLAAVKGSRRDRIWVDASDLIKGRGSKLALDSGATIEPAGVFDSPYEDFRDYLVRHNLHVMPLGYDWRLSLEAAASRLDTFVKQRLQQSDAPLYIVAHSMGGLVASLFMARHPSTWSRLRNSGGRLVQAGTPNRGSYSIPRILSGHDDSLRLLAMLDVSNGLDKWIRWASRFHGVLELGPSFGGPDFSRVQTWNDLGARTAPAAADLRAAERIKQELVAQSGQLAENGVVYVAGGPEETPTFDPDAGEIRYTDRGDGKVTWESGIPPGVPTWYVPVKHGDLLNTRSAFGGIRELLLHGHTDQLTTQQPVTSSLLRDVPGDGPPLARGDQVEFVPSTEDIEAAVLGMSSAWRGRKPSRPPVTPCEVSVVHGDLRFTENPVMVGHYRGDQIVHAEEALDHCLDGALSSRHQLDVYPGEIGTADIVLKPDRDCRAPRSPTGAIVIGLGNVGELSSGALGRAVEAGLLRYAQACRERGRDTSALKVSALLIGTGEAGISTLEALEAFLLALRNTNQALHRLQQSKSADDEPSSRAVPLTHFAHIEFVELYKDVALEALHTLSAMPERADLVIRKRIESRAGGRHRARITSAQAWWPRIQISSDGEAAGSTRTLTFTTFGGRARAPVTKSYVQRALVDRLVADTLRNSGGRNDEMAETLFELLVPAALKAGAAERRNLQLVLDASAAAYPWELLADRRSNADMPVGVAAGLLRQLRVDDVRPVSHPDDNSILVVGDPPSAMVELPGARKEADVVARQFAKRGGWTVIEQIRGGAAGISSTSIVQSLLTRDIRLLHLAGHGIYNAADPLRSGMIIGGSGSQDDPWVMITAAEISQMRLQPELVFINCCHLGRIEEPEPYHKLAASLAAAFIKAGVKAVVAAGWPVNDDAAATFATEFYRKMLGGEDFGSAVNAARRQTYAHESNTWGAYQCYGEPGFRLLMDLGVRSRVRGTYYAPDDYLDPSELTVELGNLVSRARVDVTAAQQKELSARLGELGSIAERKDWLEEVNVLASLARVYGELGHLEAAIDHYDRAARVENGGVTLHDLEQLANYRVRLGAKRESHREVRAAIRDLERLIREHGETGERLSLLGASHKRAAQIAEGRKALREELQQMTAAYCRAADLQTRNWFYAASNALLGIVLLGGPWSRKPRAGTVAADSYESSDWSSEKRYAEALGRVEVALRQQDLRDFWDAVGIPDLQVIKALAGNTVTDRLDELVDAYRETIRLYGSGREIDSVLNQWLFAQKVLASMGSAADAAALKQLCDALSG